MATVITLTEKHVIWLAYNYIGKPRKRNNPSFNIILIYAHAHINPHKFTTHPLQLQCRCIPCVDTHTDSFMLSNALGKVTLRGKYGHDIVSPCLQKQQYDWFNRSTCAISISHINIGLLFILLNGFIDIVILDASSVKAETCNVVYKACISLHIHENDIHRIIGNTKTMCWMITSRRINY